MSHAGTSRRVRQWREQAQTANHTFPGRIGKLRQEAAKLEIATEIKGDQTKVTVTVQSLVPHNLPTPIPRGLASCSNSTSKGKT